MSDVKDEMVRAPTDEEIHLKALNHTKDKLLSIVGHDVCSAIGGVISMTRMLEKRLDANDLAEARRLAGLIHRSSQDADDLLRNLVTWTRSHGKEIQFCLEMIDVQELIEGEIARMYAVSTRKGISMRIENSSSGPVRADRHMLQIILRNLLTNAMKFSHANSEIVIRCIQATTHWECQVSDTGIGMGEDLQKLLMTVDHRKQRLGTAGEVGSGFGLLLCEEFVQRHGGQLFWESIADVGTTFTFTIPVLIG